MNSNKLCIDHVIKCGTTGVKLRSITLVNREKMTNILNIFKNNNYIETHTDMILDRSIHYYNIKGLEGRLQPNVNFAYRQNKAILVESHVIK